MTEYAHSNAIGRSNGLFQGQRSGYMREKNGYMLGLDMGASGLKCVACQPETGSAVSVYTEWRLELPAPGYVELPCDAVWDALRASLRRLREEHGISGDRILSIGACALCPGLIALDASGKPLTNAIIFMDGRSVAEAAEAGRILGGQRVFDRTANRLMAGASSLPTMLWIRNHLPEVFTKTRYFAHLPTWLGLRMTGELRMDYANAAGTGVFDIHTLRWAEDFCEEAGIPVSLLPPLGQGVDLLGGLVNEEIISLGVPKGTPVAVGSGDTASTALAFGAYTHGKCFLSLGTSAVMTAAVETDSFDDRLTSRAHVFRNVWITNGAMSCGGACLAWARQALCPDLAEGGDAFAAMESLAATVAPGAGGLLFLPYLNGERSPVFDAEAKGVFFGIGLKTSRPELIRAVMEGVGYGLRQLMEIIESGTGTRLDEFSVAGGGGKSRLWLQIMADILGRALHVSDIRDAGAVGAAMLGGIASGIITREFRVHPDRERRRYVPNPENTQAYAEAYGRFVRLYPAVRNVYH